MENPTSQPISPNFQIPYVKFITSDHSDPFESTLSSISNSPETSFSVKSNHGLLNNIPICELLEKMGNNNCNSGEVSPQSYINSANNSCYITPLNSPPKMNLCTNFASFEPGFAERAATFSCFGNRDFRGLSPQLGFNDTELGYKLLPKLCKSHNGSVDGFRVSERKLGRLCGCSTPENVEFGEGSSISEQIPNERKRKPIQRAKRKEIERDDEESKAKGCQSIECNEITKFSDSVEAPKDYIHVRARRGQATDSHSLAERVRREKISERMKFLQDLIPGCNKVTGKAVMLDEIINYVQCLQRQVEFLSMKLASVNSKLHLNIGGLLSKDPHSSSSQTTYPFDSSCSSQISYPFDSLIYGLQSHHNATIPNSILNQSAAVQLPAMPAFGESTSEASSLWQDDLQIFVQMSFGQNEP